MKGFIGSIEKQAVANRNFRNVIYTGSHLQLVLMSLEPGGDIGEEVHQDTDQFFRVEEGNGEVSIDGRTTTIESGMAIVIPAGARHNIRASDKGSMKLYTLYAPPHHEDGTVQHTREEAQSSTEHFAGKTSE